MASEITAHFDRLPTFEHHAVRAAAIVSHFEFAPEGFNLAAAGADDLAFHQIVEMPMASDDDPNVCTASVRREDDKSSTP